MPHLSRALTLTAFATALLAQSAAAQTLLSGDHSIDGNLCVGPSCTGSETFGGSDDLKIKSIATGIYFEDIGGTSEWDWRIRTNDTNENSFWIEDVTDGTTPFKIIGTAPDNSVYVASDGDVGLGTSLPQIPLHVTSQSNAGFGIERTNASDGSQMWEIATFSNGDFVLFDRTNGTGPFAARAGTPNNAIFLEDDTAEINAGNRDYNFNVKWDSGSSIWADGGTGDIGMGTNTPTAPLELSRPDSFVYFRLTAVGATVDSADITYTNGPLSNGELRYNVVDGDGPEMRLDGDGRLTIVGELITAGSCSVGCDRVFEHDYALKSIEEHQAQMWQAGYLPNVGPTPENGTFNVSDKMGRMLNELEHAHIYIGQLSNQLRAEQSRIDAQSEMIATQSEQADAQIQRLDAQSKQLAQQADLIATLTWRLDQLEAH